MGQLPGPVGDLVVPGPRLSSHCSCQTAKSPYWSGQLGKRRVEAATVGVVQGAQLLRQNADGPAVRDDVMDGHEQDVLFVVQAEQPGADERPSGEIEAPAGLLDGEGPGAFGAIFRRERPQVVAVQRGWTAGARPPAPGRRPAPRTRFAAIRGGSRSRSSPAPAPRRGAALPAGSAPRCYTRGCPAGAGPDTRSPVCPTVAGKTKTSSGDGLGGVAVLAGGLKSFGERSWTLILVRSISSGASSHDRCMR